MVKNRELTAFLFGLCPLVPACSNLAYGIVLAACIWIIFFAGIISESLAEFLKIRGFEKVTEFIFTGFITVFLNFLLQGLFPIIQGAVQTYIYILGISFIIRISVDDYLKSGDSIRFPITYALLILVFALIREIAAFGSISLPVRSGFLTFYIPFLASSPPFRFLGSSAGALILLGILLFAYISRERLSLYRR